jgi:succinate dehydrogenase/fumarate reductase flavoprotein subunit
MMKSSFVPTLTQRERLWRTKSRMEVPDRVKKIFNDKYKIDRSRKKLEEELAELKRLIDEAGTKADDSVLRRLETELQDVKDMLDGGTAAKTAMIRAKKVVPLARILLH